MLSQAITKAAYQIVLAKDSIEIKLKQNEIRDLYKLFASSHNALQKGDSILGISIAHNTDEIRRKYDSLNPYYAEIALEVETLLNLPADSSSIKQSFESIKRIANNESQFLYYMNEITFMYDNNAKKKIETLKMIEFSLMSIILFILLIEIVFIFRPAINQINNFFNTINEANKEFINLNESLSEQNNKLLTTEEELRQNLEELSSTQEQLEEAHISLKGKMLAINQIVGYMELNVNKDITYINENLANWLEYSELELKSNKHNILVDKDYSLSDEYKNFGLALRSGNTLTGEFARVTKSGKAVWIYDLNPPI